jgi:hypothetical protein
MPRRRTTECHPERFRRNDDEQPPASSLFATATAVLSIFALAGSPAARAADQVPPPLAGQWALPWQGGTEYLTLADSRFMFFFNHPGQEPPMGAVSVTGTTITFYSSQTCTYQWSLSNGGLTFTQSRRLV